jgi:hypothetical protein
MKAWPKSFESKYYENRLVNFKQKIFETQYYRCILLKLIQIKWPKVKQCQNGGALGKSV